MDSKTSLEKRSASSDEPTKLRESVKAADIDVAAGLVAGKDFVLDPQEAARVRYVLSASFTWCASWNGA